MLRVSHLQVNGMKDPIGIGGELQFEWQLVSGQRNIWQKKWEFQLSESPLFTTIQFTASGLGEKSQGIYFPKLKTDPLVRYFFRIRVTDTQDNLSAWSDPASFVTALETDADWKGNFITIETEADAPNSGVSYLEKKFFLQEEKKISRAYLLATALGLYHVQLNGQEVSDSYFTPGWTSYSKRLLYQVFDCTDLLRQGENDILVSLAAGWYKGDFSNIGKRNNYGKYTAFSSMLVIAYTDGSNQTIITDSSWKGGTGPTVFSEIYHGETYDSRIPLSCKSNVMNIERPPVILESQGGGLVKIHKRLPAQKIFMTPKGETVIDFGQNLSGWVQFAIEGKDGDIAQMQGFEVLDREGNVYTENLRMARQTITYICNGKGKTTYHPLFSFQGFRYVVLKTWPSAPQKEDFLALLLRSSMEETLQFVCSNKDVNQLNHNILWGMRDNFLDIPTDSPQRDERLGWTGDTQIFAQTASYLMDTRFFYEKWLKDLALDQKEGGGVTHVVPDIEINLTSQNGNSHSACAWADAAVIIPWVLYRQFGDTKVIEDQFSSMQAWVDCMQRYQQEDSWPLDFQFGDWVALDGEKDSCRGATSNQYLCDAFQIHSTQLFAIMAEAIGKQGVGKMYKAYSEKLLTRFQQKYLDRENHLTEKTQTAHILALHFSLVPKEVKKDVMEGLLSLLAKYDGHLVTGFIGTPYFCHALSDNGQKDEAFKLLLKDDFPSWLYQVQKGATTVWENWDGIKPDGSMCNPSMNSFNHYAYGTIGEWIYANIGGIVAGQEGFRSCIIKPLISGNLTMAEMTYRSVRGPITVHWEKKEKHASLIVSIPANMQAKIVLDACKAVELSDGLDFQAGQATAGSGTYHITYELN